MAARDSGGKRVQSTEPTDIVNGSILQLNCASINLCAGALLTCYIVLTSPKKGETAVHGCNPTLPVCRVGVSQSQFFYVVSAL